MSASPTPAPANDPKAEAIGTPKCHDGIDALIELEGQTEAQLISSYGEPKARENFKMADCCHEFRIELYNTYPPGKGHDAVEIHEMTWQDGENFLTAWAHRPESEWLILDTLCYIEGTEF